MADNGSWRPDGERPYAGPPHGQQYPSQPPPPPPQQPTTQYGYPTQGGQGQYGGPGQQGGQYGPPPGGPYGPRFTAPPPPPKKRPTGWIIAGIVGALVVLVGAGVVAAATNGSDDAATGSPGGGSSTTEPASVPTSAPTSDPTSVPTSRPTSRPTTTKPSTSRPTTQTPVTRQIVAANKLYKTGAVPASKCREPSARPTSFGNVQKYYSQYLPCLNKTWKPVIIESGKPFRSPKLVVFHGFSVPTPCGPSGNTGWYCSVNSTIYLPGDRDVTNYKQYSPVWTRANMAFLIAHEYGHHIQSLTGIMQASWTRQYTMTDRAAQLEESRRRELQASCLSGVYLGADRSFFPVSGGMRTWLRWTFYNRGDQWNPVRDHGDKKNHGFWSTRGMSTPNPASCNTYASSTKLVS